MPVHDLGRSIGFTEIFDGHREASTIFTLMEVQDSDADQNVFTERFIWNQGISGAKNFIEYLDFEGRLTCTVDKVTEDSILDFLFGFDPSCVETDDHDCGTPNIGSILHAIGNWTWTSCPEFRGIATNLYETDWHVDEWNADLHVKYYWSDRELWSGTSGSGISVPVATEITGLAVDDNGVTVPVDETILYISFENVEPAQEDFEPIRDIVCDGRDMKDMLPSIPNYYEYGSELIFHYKHDEGSEEHWHHIVSPRNNWFDQEMQVARLDYKPLVLDHDNNGDPYDSMMAVQTDIQDFEGTIAYQIDTNFGNCSIVPISKDLAGDLNVADGRIQSPDPMHVFFMDQKFAFNGIHEERGIEMDYFTTEIQSSTDEDFYWDMVVGLTASQYLVKEEDLCQDKLSDIQRMPIMIFQKGSHTTSSDSQSPRHSSKIITSCPALLTLS